MLRIISLSFVFFISFFEISAFSKTQCLKSFNFSDSDFSSDFNSIWSFAHENNLLVKQDSLGTREGLCGPACLVNILQIASLNLRDRAVWDLHNLFSDFVEVNIPSKEGGVYFKDLVEYLPVIFDQIKLSKKEYSLSAKVLEPLILKNSKEIKKVKNLSLKDLKFERNQLKILFSAQFNIKEEFLSFHFQIIKVYFKGKMTIIDPYNPYISLKLEKKGLVEAGGGFSPKLDYVGSLRIATAASLVPIGIININFHK